MIIDLIRGKESHPRSIAKAISWRILGSLDTFVLSWIITGEASTGATIASVEVITKIVIYYFHERVWSAITWGRKPLRTPEEIAADEAAIAKAAELEAAARLEATGVAPTP